MAKLPVSTDDILSSIRGQRVILAADLARLFGVKTFRLNEQVKRNPDRFPATLFSNLLRLKLLNVQDRKLRS
jgi:hypothetical protein